MVNQICKIETFINGRLISYIVPEKLRKRYEMRTKLFERLHKTTKVKVYPNNQEFLNDNDEKSTKIFFTLNGKKKYLNIDMPMNIVEKAIQTLKEIDKD